MRILVTGARGKVGAATVAALADAGHDVTATDLGAPACSRPTTAASPTRRPTSPTPATRSRSCAATTPSCTPRRSPSRRATRRTGVPEQPDGDVQHARGRGAAGRPPVREHLERDRAGLLLPRAAVAARLRAGRRAAPGAAAGPVRDREALRRAADGRAPCGGPTSRASRCARRGCSGRATTRRTSGRGCASPSVSEGFWAYIDVYDLADAIRLAAEARTPGHEVVYIASPDIAGALVARGARAALPRRRRARDPAVGPAAPGRDLDRQGAAAARLRPAALVARLPRRRRPAAPRGARAASSAARPASSAAAGSPARSRPRIFATS